MTDLSLKNRILALVAFTVSALFLSVLSALYFTLVLFVCLGIVIFFADKLLNNKKIKERTAFAFFVSASCFQTFYQIFNRVHDNNKQLMTAAAISFFLAAVFAATDIKNLPYCIFAAPLICLLDIRIAGAYCILLLTLSIVKIKLSPEQNKSDKKKNSKNKKNTSKQSDIDPFTATIVSIIVSLGCLAFCLYTVFQNKDRTTETLDYLLRYFKNTLGFSILIIYFIIKLMRSNVKAKVAVIIGIILHITAIPLYLINYGWSFVSLFMISTALFLGLVCLENNDIVDSIKDDYNNHKYLFFVEFLCLLQ